MGMTPGLLPGRVPLGTEGVWESAPIERGLDAAGILQAAAAGRIGCLVLLGADPLSDFPDRDLALRALGGAGSIIAVDCFATESNERADVVLPAAAFAEKSGTTTNIEGRVSVLSQKVTPPGTARADWMIASELALRLGGDLGFTTVSSVTDEIAARAPSHRGLTATELAKRANADGVVAGAKWLEPLSREATAAPTVDGYSLRLIVSRRLYDKAIMTTMSPALAPLMPGARVHLSPYDFDRLGGQRGRAVRVSAARTHLTVEAVPDEAVPRGSAWLAFNQQNVTAAELVDASLPVNDVRVENL
jgi:NADH-quinone oxidoreductase subunit G